MVIAIIIVIVGAAIVFVWQFGKLARNVSQARKEAYQKSLCCQPCLNVLAGNIARGESVPESSLTLSTSNPMNQFLDKDGHEVDCTLFDKYVVHGESLHLMGIHDGDLLLTNKQTFEELEHSLQNHYRVVIVKRKDPAQGEVGFKSRRAWVVCSISDDLAEKVDLLAERADFAELLRQQDKSLEYLKENLLEERVRRYRGNYPGCDNPASDYHRIILSTTYHIETENDGYVGLAFSLHPLINYQGTVRHVFAVE